MELSDAASNISYITDVAILVNSDKVVQRNSKKKFIGKWILKALLQNEFNQISHN